MFVRPFIIDMIKLFALSVFGLKAFDFTLTTPGIWNLESYLVSKEVSLTVALISPFLLKGLSSESEGKV